MPSLNHMYYETLVMGICRRELVLARLRGPQPHHASPGADLAHVVHEVSTDVERMHGTVRCEF